jgi:hypothetical protein
MRVIVEQLVEWRKIGRGNRSTRRKPAPAPLCPPQIPHDQTRARTRVAVVGNILGFYSGLPGRVRTVYLFSLCVVSLLSSRFTASALVWLSTFLKYLVLHFLFHWALCSFVDLHGSCGCLRTNLNSPWYINDKWFIYAACAGQRG